MQITKKIFTCYLIICEFNCGASVLSRHEWKMKLTRCFTSEVVRWWKLEISNAHLLSTLSLRPLLIVRLSSLLLLEEIARNRWDIRTKAAGPANCARNIVTWRSCVRTLVMWPIFGWIARNCTQFGPPGCARPKAPKASNA